MPTSSAADRFALVLGNRRGAERTGDDALYREDSEFDSVRWHAYRGGPLHREHGPAVQNAVMEFSDAVLWPDMPDYWSARFLAVCSAEEDWTLGRADIWYRDGLRYRKDGPDTVFSGPYGRVQAWHRDGELHRDGGGPAVVLDTPDGDQFQGWFQGGLPHRENGPAFIDTPAGGERVEEWWFWGGQPHREDGPSYTCSRPDGERSEELWCRRGELHRENGPAKIGVFHGEHCEEHYRHGRLHREGGDPAVIGSFPDGTWRKEWFEDGLYCRETGPAKIINFADGERIERYWDTKGGVSKLPASVEPALAVKRRMGARLAGAGQAIARAVHGS